MAEYIYKILIIHQAQATSLSINNPRRHKSFEGTEASIDEEVGRANRWETGIINSSTTCRDK